MKKLMKITAALGIVTMFVGSSFAGTTVTKEQFPTQEKVGILTNASDDRVVVSFENDETAPYWVSIEDAEGNTLHTETVSESGYFNKRFDLGELQDGEYSVKVGKGEEVKSVERIYRK